MRFIKVASAIIIANFKNNKSSIVVISAERSRYSNNGLKKWK